MSLFKDRIGRLLNSQETYRYLIDQLLLSRRENTQKIFIFEELELQLPLLDHTKDHTAPFEPYSSL